MRGGARAREDHQEEADEEWQQQQQDDVDIDQSAQTSTSTQASTSAKPASKAKVKRAPPKTQAAFVHKLYSMIQNPALAHLIAWNPSGKVFSVPNPNEFSRAVLPQYFKHNNFQSFVRQLNMYGFHKTNELYPQQTQNGAQVSSDPQGIWEFQHTAFQRDRPDLLCQIKRKAPKSNASGQAHETGSGSGSGSLKRAAQSPEGSSPESSAGFERPKLQHNISYDSNASFGPESDYGATEAITAGPASSVHETDPRKREEYDFDPSGQRQLPHAPNANQDVAALQRRVVSLDGQMRQLSEMLYFAQQDALYTKGVTVGALRDILHLLSTLDVGPERRAAADAIMSELTKVRGVEEAFLSTAPQAYALGQQPQQQQPPEWQHHQGNVHGMSRSPLPGSRPQQHAMLATGGQFYFPPNRAESFARGGRPEDEEPGAMPHVASFANTFDGSDHPLQHFATGIGNLYTRDHRFMPYVASQQQQHHHQSHGGPSNGTSGSEMSSIAVSTSSGPPSMSLAYASPRPAWGPQHSNSGAPEMDMSRRGSASSNSRHSETLPPLASLLGLADGAGHGHTHGNGDEHANGRPEDMDYEGDRNKRMRRDV